jgi:hypothetical protein
MRMSVDPNDPGFKNLVPGTVVLLNGKVAPYVFTADEEQGMLIQADTDLNGKLFVDRFTREVPKVVRYGRVQVLVGGAAVKAKG